MFLQASVCPQGGEYLTKYTPPDQVHPPTPGTPSQTRYTPQDQVHPPDQVHPQDQVHPPRPGTPPKTRYTSQDQVHPPGPGTLPRPGTPPGPGTSPPRYGHCCERYASYWNAFLFISLFTRSVRETIFDANLSTGRKICDQKSRFYPWFMVVEEFSESNLTSKIGTSNGEIWLWIWAPKNTPTPKKWNSSWRT